jgi:hypothetical protein
LCSAHARDRAESVQANLETAFTPSGLFPWAASGPGLFAKDRRGKGHHPEYSSASQGPQDQPARGQAIPDPPDGAERDSVGQAPKRHSVCLRVRMDRSTAARGSYRIVSPR